MNQQCLDIQSTPRAEMNLFPLDTFAYEFPGNEIKINFEITEEAAGEFVIVHIQPADVPSADRSHRGH